MGSGDRQAMRICAAAICLIILLRATSAKMLRSGTVFWGNSDTTLLDVYSALHDPVEGVVRVFMEMHPIRQCSTLVTCQFPGSALGDLEAVTNEPFDKLMAEEELELVECFVTCQLPLGAEAEKLAQVVLVDKHGNTAVSQPVQRLQTLSRKRGWGICCAPVFSDTPQYHDWVSYHELMGVEGIHIYVAHVEGSKHKEIFGRGRSGHSRVNMAAHHLVTFHEYFQVHPKIPSKYYSQKLALNECVFRHRQMYDYIAVIDRDEFIYVKDEALKDVDLSALLNSIIGGTPFASVGMFTARYSVRCGPRRQNMLGQSLSTVLPALHAKADDVQEYAGYSVWQPDPRMPDFYNCSTDFYARIYAPMGRNCHTKSIMRPVHTDFVSAHGMHSSRHEYEDIPREVLSEGIFLKHLQCLRKGEDWSTDASLCQREPGPIDYTLAAGDGVDVCPGDS